MDEEKDPSSLPMGMVPVALALASAYPSLSLSLQLTRYLDEGIIHMSEAKLRSADALPVTEVSLFATCQILTLSCKVTNTHTHTYMHTCLKLISLCCSLSLSLSFSLSLPPFTRTTILTNHMNVHGSMSPRRTLIC